MNTSFIKTLAGLIVAISASSMALADPIDGSVSFFGDVSLSGTTLTLSSAITNSGAAGSYAGVAAGDAVTFAPLTGLALNVSSSEQAFPLPTNPDGTLWEFTDAGTGDTYTFTATSADQTFGKVSDLQWTFLGEGIASISGPSGSYTDTAGSWSIVTNQSQGGEQFTFTSVASVPDAGTTALLVVLGLAAMGAYAASRKKADLTA